MAINKSTVFALLFLLLLLSTETNLVKIHRASSRSKTKSSQENNGWFAMCESLPDFSTIFSKNKEAWLYSIPCTILVGLCGVFPLLVIPVESGHALRDGVAADSLKLLLSFAVGGLLGDVFLHLLPEAWSKAQDPHSANFFVGLWVLAGIILFLILEKLFDDEKDTEEEKEDKMCETVLNGIAHKANGTAKGLETSGPTENSSSVRKRHAESKEETVNKLITKNDNGDRDHKVVGYLNLFANFIDNFTHGLAVAGSFLVSKRVGLCTTCAILLHEIPHEIGDFAILIKSGFNKKDAAVGQIVTASGGLLGAVVGLIADHAGDQTAWILPLSSGGFIYIAMVTIIPELLEERRPRESIKQIVMMLAGIASMALVSLIH